MRIRTVATVLVAFTLAACSDSQSPTAPRSPLSAPVSRVSDLVTLDNTIDGLIDQIYTSPIVRTYAHAAWNWLETQLQTCPPSVKMQQLQAYLNQLTTYLANNGPKGKNAKADLVVRLISAMSEYVNEAIAACPAA